MDDQQRARDLRKQAAKILGDAYNAAYFFGAADDALSETPSPHCQVTITAITAALRAAPEGFGSLSPVDHVRYWAEAYGPQATEPHFQGHGVAAGLLAEYADLLERLAARPQGMKE